MVVSFEKRKKDFLSKKDKSSIGSWDKPILNLCKKINKKKDYYTLSSCSGRIVLIKNIIEKQPGLFIIREHKPITFTKLKKALADYNERHGVIYKQEPCILHVACKNLEKARELLVKAQQAGWKQSGIIALGSNRIVVELRSTEYISFPIIDKGKLLVDNDFLKILVKESNSRLKRTWQKIKNLENKL